MRTKRVRRFNVILDIIIIFAAFLFIFYYITTVRYTGNITGFSLIWLLAGCLMIMGAGVHLYLVRLNISIQIPTAVRRIVFAALILILTAVFILTGMIVSKIKAYPENRADYLIVLGAQVKGSGITNSLRLRLDAAYDYLVKHPNTKAIVSGGQGPDEHISEAQAMQTYLTQKGIRQNRILLEDRSTNTRENIRFSRELIPQEELESNELHITVVTNNFHVFRSQGIGRKQGLSDIEGLAAPSDRILFPQLMIREILALGKDILLNHVKLM